MTADRVLLTLATLAFCAGIYALMYWGWRNRRRRQSDLPPPPSPPEVPGRVLVGAVPGLYVGTTSADDWLDRIAVHRLGHRASGWLAVHDDGVHIEREGLAELYLPFELLDDVEVGDALAGKVVARGGMLLLSWRLGSRQVLTGFRADDHAQHRRLADAVRAHLTVEGTPA